MIHAVSTLPLASKHRVSQIKFHPTEPYLAVQSHDRSVEIFRVRTEEEVQKKQARRKKRSKEKKEQGKDKGKSSKGGEEQEESPEASLVDYFTPHLVVRASGKVRSFDFGSHQSSSKSIPQVCR
jgi:U3 small nucleolar RNA-associated protein 12